MNTLRENAELESEEIQQNYKNKFSSLQKSLRRFEYNNKLGVSLPDLVYRYGYRKAGVSLDYTRALFPTLGLTWKINYTLEKTIKQIYISQKDHVTRVILYHGPPKHY